MKTVQTLFLAFFLTANIFGQNPLENTQWRIHVNPGVPNMEVLLDYHKSSITMSSVEGVILGEYAYTVEGNTMSYLKIEGGDPCPNSAVGKMAFEIKDDKMYLKYISDDCPDRKEAWVTLPNGGIEPAIRVKQANKITSEQEKIKAEIKAWMGTNLLKNGKLDLATLLNAYNNSPDFVGIGFGGTMANYEQWKAGFTHEFKEFGAENQALEHKSETIQEHFRFLNDNQVQYTWTGKESFKTPKGLLLELNPFSFSAIVQKINGEWKAVFVQESASQPKMTK